MSLQMAVLALLAARPMTGFDVTRQFDTSVGYLWSAPHTQIYPELRKLEQAGFVEGVDVPRGQRGTKRQYQLTKAGADKLAALMDTVEQPRPERDPLRLKSAYMEWADPSAARAQLLAHMEFYRNAELEYRQQRDDLLRRKQPLLRDRLESVPASQQEAVVEFKAFAFAGLIARARSEVEWAQEGLALLERLNRASADRAAVAESTLAHQSKK